MGDPKVMDAIGPLGEELVQGLERHGLRVVRAEDLESAGHRLEMYRGALKRVANRLAVSCDGISVQGIADAACNHVGQMENLLAAARDKAVEARREADGWQRSATAAWAREDEARKLLEAHEGEDIVDVAKRVVQLLNVHDEIDENYTMALEVKQAEADRLRAAVEKARDTFADFTSTMKTLGRPVIAIAADIARSSMDYALNAPPPSTPLCGCFGRLRQEVTP